MGMVSVSSYGDSLNFGGGGGGGKGYVTVSN